MTVYASTEADGSAIVTIGGRQQQVQGTSLTETRTKVAALVIEHARTSGEPQRFVTTEPDGSWSMIVHPDGRIEDVKKGIKTIFFCFIPLNCAKNR